MHHGQHSNTKRCIKGEKHDKWNQSCDKGDFKNEDQGPKKITFFHLIQWKMNSQLEMWLGKKRLWPNY